MDKNAFETPYPPVNVAGLQERGVAVPFVDAFGIARTADQETLIDLAGYFPTEAPERPIIATPGRYHPELHGVLELESGYKMNIEGVIPEGDYGYHHLTPKRGTRRFIISAPEWMPQPPRTWGFAVQLYASRTKRSWGIGDFTDLITIARKSKEMGSGMVLISPIHATAPTLPQQNSPYSPSSRSWLNLQYVDVENVPGGEEADLSDLRKQALALNSERIINRDAVWAIKLEALRRIWANLLDSEWRKTREFIRENGEDLDLFASYSAMSMEFNTPNWREWDKKYQRPDTPAVKKMQHKLADEIQFWKWCQYVADVQFKEACNQDIDIVADLAVGFDSCGADAWAYQDQLVFDYEVGCPPDAHNTEGQRWGLPPFNPDSMVNTEFDAFRKMVKSGLRHAQALRIDHVMQLWRLFWVPSSKTAHEGAYIRYPSDALLAVLRLEAHRSGSWICGEDMGTVADGVREQMSSIGMLGYRAAMRTNPADNPVPSMAASSTHDQVTVAGALTGFDVKSLDSIGKGYDPAGAERQRQNLMALAGIPADKTTTEITEEDVEAAVLAQYSTVGSSDSLVAVVTMDDAGAIRERPNMPGTIDAWPNWRLSLPDAEELLDGSLAQQIAQMMSSFER